MCAATSDGWVAIAADSLEDVSTLLTSLDATDESSLIAALATRRSEDVLRALTTVGVPCGPLKLAQKSAFFDDPDNRAAGLVASYEHIEWGKFEQPGALWYFGDMTLKHELAPPTLGQHTVEILSELGVSSDSIDALLADGVAVAYAPAAR